MTQDVIVLLAAFGIAGQVLLGLLLLAGVLRNRRRQVDSDDPRRQERERRPAVTLASPTDGEAVARAIDKVLS